MVNINLKKCMGQPPLEALLYRHVNTCGVEISVSAQEERNVGMFCMSHFVW
jgi:hypothetical protein